MSARLTDLKLWQTAVTIAGETTLALPQSGNRLAERAALTAIGVAELVAKAHGDCTRHEQRALYLDAKQHLLVLETQWAVLRHADMLKPSKHSELLAAAEVMRRLLSGYLVYIDRQLEEAKGAS